MKIFFNIILALLVSTLLFSCKKGETASPHSGKTFSQVPKNGSGQSFSSITGPPSGEEEESGDDSDDDDWEEEDDSGSSVNYIEYKASTYESIAISCGSGSGYYGVLASNSSPAFSCTVYFASQPTTSTSYAIEDITGSSPSTGAAWLVVSDSGIELIASSGTVYVTVSNGKVAVDFSFVTVQSDAGDMEEVSGTFACP